MPCYKFVVGKFSKPFLAFLTSVVAFLTAQAFTAIPTTPLSAQVVVQPQIIVEPQSNGQPPIYQVPGAAIAQPASQAGGLTIESIYKSKKFTPSKFSPKWEESGAKFVQSKPSKEINGGSDLIAIDPQTGEQTTLLSAAQMIPPGKSKSLSVADHQWAKDRELALIFTNTRKVWRHNSRGDYWLLNRTSGSLRQVGKQHPPSSLMFAKFSPCLLYTSPSPRDATLSRMPSSA